MTISLHIHKYIYLYLFLSLGYIDIFAQTYQLTTYRTDDGLPTNLAKAVLQDKDGFVWVSSDEGLSRFDGQNFINFKDDLPTNYTKSLFVSQKKEVFIITDLGILKINNYLRKKTQLVSFLEGGTNNNDSKKTMYPKKVFEDCQNRFWVSEPNSILKYKGGKTKRYNFEDKYSTTIYLRSFELVEFDCKTLFATAFTGYLLKYNLQKDKFEEIALPQKITNISANLKIDNQTLWLGAKEGVFELKFDKNFEVLQMKKIINLPNISYLTKDHNGNILLGTWNKGLFKTNQSNTKSPSKIEASKAKVINHLFVDKEHNVWVSSDDGIEVLKPNFFHELRLSQNQGYIEDIFYVNDSEVLVSNGSGLFSILSTEDSISSKVIKADFPHNVHSVCKYHHEIVVGLSDGTIVFLKNGEIQTSLNLRKYGRTVFILYPDKNNYIWACQYGEELGVSRIDAHKNVKHYSSKENIHSVITAITQAKDGTLYLGGRGAKDYLYKYNYEEDHFENISIPINIKSQNTLIINDIVVDNESNIWLASNLGLWKKTKNKIIQVNLKKYTNENIKALEIDKQDSQSFWIGTNLGIIKYKENAFVVFQKKSGLSTVTTSLRGIIQNKQGNLYVATAGGLNYSEAKVNTKQLPIPSILSLEADKVSLENLENLRFENNVNLKVQVQTFTYPNEFVSYQYRIIGLNEEWSAPDFQNEIKIQRIPYGDYTLEIRAKEQGSFKWSKIKRLNFHVKIPWHLTWGAIIFYILSSILLLFSLLYANSSRLKKQKKKLEILVDRRTMELQVMNEELYQQAEEITVQRDYIEDQNKSLNGANKMLTNNIKVARTIQDAVLPYKEKFKTFFQEYFILNKPRNIVSGDFYWLEKIENQTFLVVADATGHGVSGGFTAMIGSMMLDRIILNRKVFEPDQILTNLHEEIYKALKQDTSNNNSGMDLSLVRIIEKEDSFEVCFAGAKNDLLYFDSQTQSMQQIKATRKSIGGKQNKKISFQQNTIMITKDCILYLSSDGLTDQNDICRRKFGKEALLQNLQQNIHSNLKTQGSLLEKKLNDFMEGTEQRDDILWIGVKL